MSLAGVTAGPRAVPQACSAPAWKSSMPLMQRISEDLPDPEGPQITIRSRCHGEATSRKA